MGLKLNSGVYVGTKGSVLHSIVFKSRQDAISGDYKAPPKTSASIKKFFHKHTTNHFDDFRVIKNADGTFSAIGDNPGIVKGSHAVYVKIVGPKGGLKSVYKTTYDNNGNKVHTKVKGGNKK